MTKNTKCRSLAEIVREDLEQVRARVRAYKNAKGPCRSAGVEFIRQARQSVKDTRTLMRSGDWITAQKAVMGAMWEVGLAEGTQIGCKRGK